MDAELQQEQRRVDMVEQKLNKRLQELQHEVGSVKSHMVEIRQGFWDEVTVNLDESDDVAETMTSIRQQAGVLSERERRYRLAIDEYRRLEKLQKSPYFARIDLTEADGVKSQIYIGTSSFLDDDGETFLVYDWRAPVSSVYYDYQPGPVSYDTPGGTIHGQMDLKRQFIIRDSIIRSMFDTGETIGDELLQQVLGGSADTQLKNIVATIQKEQNRVIRNDNSRMLVVQGAAGSGKTSAALQRIAYLLYKYRQQINADQIVLFSPNSIFGSYVSTVLPDLGEENMQQTTFQQYLERRIGKGMELEDPFTQIEYVLTAEPSAHKQVRMAAMKFKSSPAFLDIIQAFTDSLVDEGLEFRDLRLGDDTLVTAREMKAFFYHPDSASSVRRRIEELREWLLEGLKKTEQEERKKEWVEMEIELLDKEDYQKAYRKARSKTRSDGMHEHDAELEWLRQKVVHDRFKPLRSRIRRLGFIHLPKTYANLYRNPDRVRSWLRENKDASIPAEWPAICKQTIAAIGRRVLHQEDATPYLYLKERLFGFHTYTKVRHVIVDEGQDFSPLQFEFLKRMFPHSKMTVLGDFNQAIHVHAEGLDFRVLGRLYGEDNTEHIHLTRSYRSTRQIVEFTKGIVSAGLSDIVPFQRDGRKPTMTTVPDRSALARQIAGRLSALKDAYPSGTIALICKTEQESYEAHAALTACAPELAIDKISKETTRFAKGVLVIPSYLAKGVEFDAVVVYDASRDVYGKPYERKLLYTVCTRAMHELHLYMSADPSPFLSGIDPSLYDLEPVLETSR